MKFVNFRLRYYFTVIYRLYKEHIFAEHYDIDQITLKKNILRQTLFYKSAYRYTYFIEKCIYVTYG